MKAELNNDFEVRTFTEEFRYEVASFLRDVLQEYNLLNDAGDLSSIMARISRRYSDENAGFWLLRRDNKIIGTVALRSKGCILKDGSGVGVSGQRF
jgi:N-acetylglutamate synthase-like GNAT family acetyltransferase